MSCSIKLWVGGARACFTRPELKAERVSYDVITPSAARGIIEAVHWKPAIRWMIDKLHVLRPIRFESIRRNEVTSKVSGHHVGRAMSAGSTNALALTIEDERTQRASLILRDVAYIIEAHVELTDRVEGDTVAKHIEMFKRRASKGQCFHQPCLGTREFPAEFELIDGPAPLSALPPDQRNLDLGWMLYDIDFENDRLPMFYRPVLEDGIIDVAGSRPAKARR